MNSQISSGTTEDLNHGYFVKSVTEGLNSGHFINSIPVPAQGEYKFHEVMGTESLEQRIARFLSNSKLNWNYIGDEQYRVYSFPDGQMQVDGPLYLNVNDKNNHRIITRMGTSVYIPFKWMSLEWVVEEGKPFFAF